jgi:pyruvate/2-oxoglutarate dehydrogenase complex dihydrolipoamide dehydrogenase (E3) component
VSGREVSEDLIVLGAAAVGTEMATLNNQLGSKVTLISNVVLSKMVSEVGKMVRER